LDCAADQGGSVTGRWITAPDGYILASCRYGFGVRDRKITTLKPLPAIEFTPVGAP
jgi:hypothetical protein